MTNIEEISRSIGDEVRLYCRDELTSWFAKLVAHTGQPAVPPKPPAREPARKPQRQIHRITAKDRSRMKLHGKYLSLVHYAPADQKAEARKLYKDDPRKAIAYLARSKKGGV